MTPQLSAFLTEHGFQSNDINAPQADGRFTPLMRAAKLGRLDIVDELLTLGVDLNALNADGCNALWLACYNGSHELIERLIAAGVNIDQQNGNGASALTYVSSNCCWKRAPTRNSRISTTRRRSTWRLRWNV